MSEQGLYCACATVRNRITKTCWQISEIFLSEEAEIFLSEEAQSIFYQKTLPIGNFLFDTISPTLNRTPNQLGQE